MSDFIRDITPDSIDTSYRGALAKLQAPDAGVRIAHLDSGLAPHRGLGQADGFSPNIRMDLGLNVFDPEAQGTDRPTTDLRRSNQLASGLIEYPAHGVKTLSVILSDTPELRGLAPGIEIVPYRTANGPLFRGKLGPYAERRATAALGDALKHVMTLDPVPQVVSISMGNPDFSGPLELFRWMLGGEIGIARSTREQIDRAYEDHGIIIVCAAGQVIDRIVQPALLRRTIAVGGFDKQGGVYRHYPINGYNPKEYVDVWAQAERINRASFQMGAVPPVQTYAETEGPGAGDPSGTSYAAPQVAAAAALWWVRYKDWLMSDEYKRDPWKRVEAFRAALQASSDQRTAKLSWSQTGIRALNVERLLNQPPMIPADGSRRSAAA